MKQYIKKALWIIPFVFSLNLHSQTFEFLNYNGNNLASDFGNWENPSNSTQPDSNDFKNNSVTFDLLGETVDFKDMRIGDITISNGTITNTGTLYVVSSNPPSFNSATIDFTTNSNTVFYNTSNQFIANLDYYNLKFSSGSKTIRGSVSVKGTLEDISGNEILISSQLSVDAKLDLKSSSSIVAHTNTVITLGYVSISPPVSLPGYITDARTNPNFPCLVKVAYSATAAGTDQPIPGGEYERLEIFNNCSLKTNSTISFTDSLIMSNSNAGYIFTIPATSQIELKNNNWRIYKKSTSSPYVFNKIKLFDGKLLFTNTSPVNFDMDIVGTSTASLPSATVDYIISDLEINSTNTVTIAKDIQVAKSIILTGGTLTLNGGTSSDPTDLMLLAGFTSISRSTGKLDLNYTYSRIIFTGTPSLTSDKTISIPDGTFNNNTLGSLRLTVTSNTYKVFIVLNSNLTLLDKLELTRTNNILTLNGFKLTTNNITGSNARVKCSLESSLELSTGTGTIYFDQTNNSTKTIKNISVTNGGTLIIASTTPVWITGGTNYGTVTVASSSTLNTNNVLTLKSDINGTARIANSPGNISGRYYAEHYIAGGQREFRFLCAPVKGATALQWRNNGSTSGSSTNYVGIHISGTNGATDSFDATTANKPSAFYYDESSAGDVTNVNSTGTDDPGWKSITKGGHYQLTNGVGYRVLVRGDRNTNLTTSNPTASATTITSYGSYPRTSGTFVTINVNNSNRAKTNNGLNLIGNPYPSAIDWNSISSNSRLSNVDNGYATYDPRNQKYVAWNGSLGDATQYISAGQAFFVMCTNSGSGSVKIDESDKYAGGPGGSFFLEKLTNHMRINLWYDSIYNSDAFLHFRSDAQDVKDVWDIQQFYTNGTNIATNDKNGKSYKINSMGEIDSVESIPLSVAKTPEAQLKLSFYDVTSFEGYKIELEDRYLKITTPVTEGSVYTFDITADSNSVKDGRFYLNFTRLASANNKIIQTSKIATIHPNPVTDNLNISLLKEDQTAQYEVFNVTGQLLANGKFNSQSTSINTKYYTPGTYYVVLKTNKTSQTIQFVK